MGRREKEKGRKGGRDTHYYTIRPTFVVVQQLQVSLRHEVIRHELDQLQVPTHACVMQGVVAVVVSLLDFCALFDERFDDPIETFLARHVQSGLPIVVRPLRTGSGVEEQLGDLLVTVEGRVVEGYPTEYTDGFEVSSLAKQQLCDVGLVVVR